MLIFEQMRCDTIPQMGCDTMPFGSNLSQKSSISPSDAPFRFLETPLCSFRSPLACSKLFGQLAITFQQSLDAKPLPLIAHSRPVANSGGAFPPSPPSSAHRLCKAVASSCCFMAATCLLAVQMQLTALIAALPTAKQIRDRHKAHKSAANVTRSRWAKVARGRFGPSRSCISLQD
jgi:hypothetical protein